nr:hypothetical protein Iba_chr11aCG7600 [Ipomoea batatas]GMD51927.1 hypothetical protein Iba_chr11bCG7010 [Ipomoea batatas]GMD55414.1 hypothetical protein Iba_chr11dCG7710 [Ipomoea batatas]
MILSFAITMTSRIFLHTAWLRSAAFLRTTKRMKTNQWRWKISCLQNRLLMLSSTPWIFTLLILWRA